jgi:hypothetical protein
MGLYITPFNYETYGHIVRREVYIATGYTLKINDEYSISPNHSAFNFEHCCG